MTTPVRERGLLAAGNERRRPDLVLIFCLLLLSALSVLMIYSASAPPREALGLDPGDRAQRQVIFAIVAAAAFAIGSFIPHRSLHTAAPLFFVGTLAALLLVLPWLPFGEEVNTAQRWISIGAFQFQPSEWAKPAMVLMLAAILAVAGEGKLKWERIFITVAVVSVPAYLILLQPDLGTTLVFGFTGAVMVFAAGGSALQLAGVAVGGTAAVFTVLRLRVFELADYQRTRFDCFLEPGTDPLGFCYSQAQSQIAIGSGGPLGRGLFEGPQTNLSFIPEQTTDFIFTAIGEQLGFLGGTLVLVVYGLLIWRVLRIGAAAPDRFGMLVAMGVAAFLTFHVFVNVGMTLGIVPVTGLPLPFMSQGGSAFVAMALGLGFVHSIWVHRSRVPARVPTVT